jgi:adenosylhomocysteine nucleosidase
MSEMERIGLITAMPLESRALLREIRNWRRVRIGAYKGSQFRIVDRDCFLITSGVGRRRAMNATSSLLDAISPQILISFGIAGAITDDLSIGDVVIPQQTCLLENEYLGELRTLAGLSTKGWFAAEEILRQAGASLSLGTAITTRTTQLDLEKVNQLHNPILEMETSGIAQVAEKSAIPLLSLRSISDGPLQPLPFNLENIYNEKDDLRLMKLIQMILKHPQILTKVVYMIRNSRIAANNAARTVHVILKEPSSIISFSGISNLL